MASTRKFGIVTTVSGFTGIKVNSINRTYNTESAEARDEKGQIIDIAAYGSGEEISVDGLTTGSGVKPGSIVKLGAKNYLITAASESESNTAFVTQNATARYAPNAELWYITTGNVMCAQSATFNSDSPSAVPSDMIGSNTTEGN